MLSVSEDSLFFFILMSTALLLVLLGFFFAFIQLYRRRQMIFKSEQEKREQEFNKELIRSQLEIREKVMQNISHEIHDNVGQSLIVAKMQISTLTDEQHLDQIKVVENLLTRSIRDLRGLSRTLNGDYILREGLNQALREEVEMINNSKKLVCKLNSNILPTDISANAEIIVFRCIQEILSNSIKHSEANKIEICLFPNNNKIHLEISDNGKGLPENWKQNRGLGMDSIYRRINLLNGNLNVTTATNQGTKFSAILPRLNIQEVEVAQNSHSR